MTDVIFLHLPGALSPYRSPDHLLRVDSLPIGVLGLADLLQRSGISSEVVHLGVEWMEAPPFSLASYLKDKSPRTVALDLHWHHQSFDVIETARQIKAVLPQTYILLGGLSASFFHEEIMKDFPSVDGIIRGERLRGLWSNWPLPCSSRRRISSRSPTSPGEGKEKS